MTSQEKIREPNILVYCHSSKTDHFSNEINELGSALSEELRIHDFNVVLVKDETDVSDLIETAGWLEASFVLEALFDKTQSETLIDISVYSSWNKERIAAVSGYRDKDEFFQNSIRKSLLDIIPLMKKLLLPEEKIPVQHDESVPEADTVPETETVQYSPPAENKESGFYTCLELAPLLTTGEATEYFIDGIDLSFLGAYRWERASGSLIAGPVLSYNYFRAEGVMTSSENTIFSLGGEIRYQTTANSFLNLYFRLAGGSGLIILKAENSETLRYFIPFVSSGLGAQFILSPNSGLQVGINYKLFRENSLNITGFTPNIGLYFSF